MPNPGRPKGSRNKASDIDFQRRLAKATEKGRLQAQKEAQRDHAKFNLEHLWTSLSEHIGKAMDRIDPIETAAIMGATVIIKNALPSLAGIESFRQKLGGAWSNIPLFPPDWAHWITQYQSTAPPTPGATPEQMVMDWVIAFVLAYLCVHHFGLIMQTVGSGVQGLLKMAGLLVAV